MGARANLGGERRGARLPSLARRLPSPASGLAGSVEDDATCEELDVVWEIEPGTAVIERAELPPIAADCLDDPAELDAFLDAVRWGAVTSADQRSLQIEDYQLEPLVRALRSPRTALLVADDVGPVAVGGADG